MPLSPPALFGPVFQAELLRTSRRRRYYVLRVLYGLILLFLIMIRFGGLYALAEYRGGTLLITDIADVARSMFYAFTAVQLITLLLLVPALVGGSIADEKQRKTLHYLMASRLSGAEIVLDKLAARLVNVGVFVLIGMPVLALLNLLGGVAWEEVSVAYAATAVTTFFVATLAVLASTVTRRVRQAVLLAYMLQVLWLFGPVIGLILFALYHPGSPAYWTQAFQSWVPLISPLFLWNLTFHWPVALPIRTTPALLFELYVWSMGSQVVAGLLVLLVSVLRLRPIFRRQEESPPRTTWLAPRARRPRWLRQPPCGDDAVLWKERYFTRTDMLTKLVVLPATVVFTVFMVLRSGIDESLGRAFADIWGRGFGGLSYAQTLFNEQLRWASPYYVALWLLSLAGATASGVTTERERDTWVSLIATPLTGGEILRGKVLGAVWGLRGFGALIGLFWVTGLLLGAVHPIGFLLALAALALLTWFVALLGTYASLRERSTSRALTATLLALLFLNGGYLIFWLPITYFGTELPWLRPQFPCTPYIVAQSLLSYDDVAYVREAAVRPGLFRLPITRPVEFCAGTLLLYAVGAVFMTRRLVRGFDAIIDRPRVTEELREVRRESKPAKAGATLRVVEDA
jgi:ABC-type transport system involved in multi-copper enzyme maturation permease subunit